MPREFSRNQRMGTEVLRTLNEVLRFETKDPRLDGVSLTAVELTRDLSVARLHYSLLDPNGDPATAQEGLRKAAGFLRGKLGGAIKIRHVPELRFLHDDSAEHGAKISQLIDSALHADDHS